MCAYVYSHLMFTTTYEVDPHRLISHFTDEETKREWISNLSKVTHLSTLWQRWNFNSGSQVPEFAL